MKHRVFLPEEIPKLMSGFKQQLLTKSDWTHEAHLAAAIWFNWHHARHALVLMRKLIIAHNESVGTPNTSAGGYRETITCFWIHRAKEFLHDNHFSSAEDACNAFILSDLSQREAPLGWWSRELLFSSGARLNKTAPDLKPLKNF